MTATSTSPSWALNFAAGPIVSVTDAVPPLDALVPLERRKPRPGEPYRFGVDVVIEPVGRHRKRAKVSSPLPGGLSFEIHSDEGKVVVGGDEGAPTPLAYFAAGVGFCLMTHITGYLTQTKIEVRRLKIELRGNFMTTLGHLGTGGQGEGGCDGFESFVVIDSDASPEEIKALVAVCERACIASQTLARAIPTSLGVVLNGQTL
ncbi:MAG: OsmC family protein [Caulobacter sp.]|nr:OsmC family protein [Caulobacter sp.]